MSKRSWFMSVTKMLRDRGTYVEFFGNMVDQPTEHGFRVFVWRKTSAPLLREIQAALNRGESYEGMFDDYSVESLHPETVWHDKLERWMDTTYSEANS